MATLTDRFDLDGPPITVLSEVTAPSGQFIQGLARDDVGQLFYVSQVMPGGIQLPGEASPVSGADRNINGDLQISKLSPGGSSLGVMYLTGFGHGQTFGVEPILEPFGEGGFGEESFGGGAWLWIETDANMDGTGFGTGRKVARVQWESGAVVDYGDVGLDIYDPVPGATRVFPSLDVERQRLLLSWFDGATRHYNVYDLDSFKSRDFTPISSTPQAGITGTLQGAALHGRYIYLYEGTAYDVDNPPPGNTYIVVLDSVLGTVLETTLNQAGSELAYREPEGITVIDSPGGPQLVFGFATQTSSPRGMAFFSFAPLADVGEWLFTTPTVSESPFAWNPLMERYRMDRAVSIVETSPGVYEQVRYDAYTSELGAVNYPQNPNQDTTFWPAVRAGLHYFRGGYEWIVSTSTKTDIINSDAAEESNFSAIESEAGFGQGGFGEGGFGA